MATLYLKDFAQLNTFKDIYAVTWQLSYNPEFKEIFFTDHKDVKNIYRVNIKIPDELVRDYLKPIYARVKVYYKADNNRLVDSDWLVLKENRSETDALVLKYRGFTIGRVYRENGEFKPVNILEKIKTTD